MKKIKEVCKDTAWFEMRLETYFSADEDEFYEWKRVYDYDWV